MHTNISCVCFLDRCALSYANVKCILVLTYNYKVLVKIPANMVCLRTVATILYLYKLVNYAIGRTVLQKLIWSFKTLTNVVGIITFLNLTSTSTFKIVQPSSKNVVHKVQLCKIWCFGPACH